MARKEVRTYTNLWKYEKILFAIEDYRLPVPVSYRMLISFLASFLIILGLTRLPLLGVFSNEYWLMIGISGFIAWFFTKQTLEGKRPDRFVIRFIVYSFSKRRLNRYTDSPRPHVYKYSSTITYRKTKDVDEDEIKQND